MDTTAYIALLIQQSNGKWRDITDMNVKIELGAEQNPLIEYQEQMIKL